MANEEFNLEDFREEEFSLDDFETPKESVSQEKMTTRQVFDKPLMRIAPGEMTERRDPFFRTGDAMAPFVDMSRGVLQGTADFYRLLNGGAKLVEAVTGLERGGLFERWAEEADATAQALPASSQDPVSKTIWEMAGRAIPISSEFALTPGGSTIGKFAVNNAITEFEEKESFGSIVKGASTGAIVGMSFPIAKAGLKMLQQGGKNLAFSWLRGKVGEDTARDFVDNPFRYNLNPFGKRKTSREINTAIENAKKNFNAERDRALSDMKLKQQNMQNDVRERLIESKKKLAEAQAETSAMLKGSQQKRLEEVVTNQQKVMVDAKTAVTDKATNIYVEGIQNFNRVKQTAGEAVGMAVKNTLEKNPGAGIAYQKVSPDWFRIIRKSPFNIDKQGNFSLRTAADTGLQSEMKVLEKVHEQFRSFGSSQAGGKLHLKYLEDLHSGLGQRATAAYKAGRTELANTYRDLSKLVNPANIAKSNKRLFPEIDQANRQFGVVADNHKRAMRNFYKEDAAGVLTPDPGKALSIIKKGNKQEMLALEKSELSLPASQRMMPKLKDLVSQEDQIVTAQKAVVRNNRKVAQRELAQLRKQQVAAKNAIDKQARTATVEARRNAKTRIDELTRLKQEEYNVTIGGLEKLEQKLADEKLLMSWMVKADSVQHNIQRAAVFSSIFGGGAAKVGVPGADLVGAGSMGLAVGLSPMVGSSVTKLGARGMKAAEAVLKPAVESEQARQIVGSRIMRDLLRQ